MERYESSFSAVVVEELMHGFRAGKRTCCEVTGPWALECSRLVQWSCFRQVPSNRRSFEKNPAATAR